MKRFIIILSCVALMVCFFTLNVQAAGSNYIALKAGMYSPQSDELEDWDNGFNGEVAYGYYFNRNVAMEIGLGYFHTERSESGFISGIGSATADGDVDVMPFTIALKGIYPIDKLELYGIVGIGAYFSTAEITVSTARGSVSADGDDVSFGGFLGIGANYNITDQVFIGVEGKYLWSEASWTIAGEKIDANLDGWTITGNLGFRF